MTQGQYHLITSEDMEAVLDYLAHIGGETKPNCILRSIRMMQQICLEIERGNKLCAIDKNGAVSAEFVLF